MRIAILGAGAMGLLFGSYLAKNNEIYLVDVIDKVVEHVQKNGVVVVEKDGSSNTFHLHAYLDTKNLPKMDLVIVFVKSMFTIQALETNKNLIGKDTYLMTLQNGAGHESKLLKFQDKQHVIIGSTQHNSSILEIGVINHGGSGISSISLLDKNNEFITDLAENMTSCGIECQIADNVQYQIWKKLFTNTAASSLTGLLQVPLGFIHDSPNANKLMRELAREAVTVANGLGLDFKLDEVIDDVEKVLIGAPNGYTSIYADLRDGRRCEVDTISGSVVDAAESLSIDVPFHRFVTLAIHAMEDKNRQEKA